MQALVIMPFAKGFIDVHKAMERACASISHEADGSQPPGPHKDRLRQLQCVRIDQESGTLDIVKALIDAIRNAAFCIADITGNNENVLWELGFAMALEKPVIILTQNRQRVGFDLRNMRNIEYSRDNLDQLEKSLVAEIRDVVKMLPDLSPLSTQSSFGKALAMSSASPTYFLDSSYTIKYINEAASSLFEINEAGEYWIGRKLRDFINSKADRIENLQDVERNLQIQTEHIQALVNAGMPTAICPFNFEVVVLRTDSFGTIEFRKTAVAVHDPNNGRVNGWVVSFNVVNATDLEAIRRFHEAHKYVIQGRLSWHEIPPELLPPPADVPGAKNLASWIEQGCPNPVIVQAKSYAEKQIAFEFATSVMKTPRYGLSSVRNLDPWFFDYNRSEYLMLRTPDGDLVGVARLHLNHDIGQYKNLEGWVTDLIEDRQTFADAGAYIHPGITSENRRTCLAALLGHASYVCDSLGQVYVYAQVPVQAFKLYRKFMFSQAGGQFSCPGWSQQWIPVILKCLVLGPDAGERERWEECLVPRAGDSERERCGQHGAMQFDPVFWECATRAFGNASRHVTLSGPI